MQISIHPSTAHWTVFCGGALIGESWQALELREGDHPPVLYFARPDVTMDLLERSSLTTVCPHKGLASYFHIITPAARVENAVWSYETPKQPMGAIAGALAFQANRVILKCAADAPNKIAL